MNGEKSTYLGGRFQGIPIDSDGIVGDLFDASYQTHRILGVCGQKRITTIDN